MSHNNTIGWERDTNGIVTLTLDDPSAPVNVICAKHRTSLETAINRLEVERHQITGVIVTSAKDKFLVGSDLDELRALRPFASVKCITTTRRYLGCLRRLESLGRPVVAAISGSALDGGLEIALACHHRIAVDDRQIELGLTQVLLGLMPSGGGVVRTVRLLGLESALVNVLFTGTRHGAQAALELGLVDELVADPEELIAVAKFWIASNPDPIQTWDAEDFELPGGSPSNPEFFPTLWNVSANLQKELKGANYPAPHSIMAAAVEGAQVDFDTATEIESRYFTELATGTVAQNMIQMTFDLKAVKNRRHTSAPNASFRSTKAVILGADMGAASIAYVLAKFGIDVVIRHDTFQSVQDGREFVRQRLEKDISRGRSSAAEADLVRARVMWTDKDSDVAGADLAIEAMVASAVEKAQAFARIEPYLAESALMASVTAISPIEGLAKLVSRPQDMVGLHILTPAGHMTLAEIIRGTATTDQAIQRALDLAAQLSKTPILVNDRSGFFISRVLRAFVNEGISMLAERIPAASIVQACWQAGYQSSALQIGDDLGLHLLREISRQTQGEAKEISVDGHPAEAVIDRMLDDFGRAGRRSNEGFYDYVEGERSGLWPGLNTSFGPANFEVPLGDLKDRLLIATAIEAVRCLDEGVISSVADANIGSILGIGFPKWTGGVLQYINGYAGGLTGFGDRGRALALIYGERFTPPDSLETRERVRQYYFDPTGTDVGVSVMR